MRGHSSRQLLQLSVVLAMAFGCVFEAVQSNPDHVAHGTMLASKGNHRGANQQKVEKWSERSRRGGRSLCVLQSLPGCRLTLRGGASAAFAQVSEARALAMREGEGGRKTES